MQGHSFDADRFMVCDDDDDEDYDDNNNGGGDIGSGSASNAKDEEKRTHTKRKRDKDKNNNELLNRKEAKFYELTIDRIKDVHMFLLNAQIPR